MSFLTSLIQHSLAGLITVIVMLWPERDQPLQDVHLRNSRGFCSLGGAPRVLCMFHACIAQRVPNAFMVALGLVIVLVCV